MPLGDLTRGLILARQLHSMAFVTLLSDRNHAGNPSQQNAWQALSIVFASVGHSSAASSSCA